MQTDDLAKYGDLLQQALIDIMAEDFEMDADVIAEELEACGYEAEEALALALRPWADGGEP